MAQLSIPLVLFCYAAVVLSLQQRPNCSQLRNYALRGNLRDRFAMAIMVGVPAQAMSESLKYDCALEGMAGLILEENGGTGGCDSSLKMTQLNYEIEVEPGIKLRTFVEQAINAWKHHLLNLGTTKSFGCNYKQLYGMHKFVCLFKWK